LEANDSKWKQKKLFEKLKGKFDALRNELRKKY
jgi:hypothetical protein